jgi:hypothetical protein
MEKPLNPLLIVIPPSYVKAILKLHEKLEGKKVEWALSGNLGEALRTVRVEPDCIEIVTSKDGAQQIHDAVDDFNPSEITQTVQELPRKTSFQGKDYPVYSRSHYFEFGIDDIPVRVHGDLQFRVNDWEWGDILQFEPESMYIVNRKTNIVPLQIKYEIYQSLGWTDKAENIKKVFQTRQMLLNRRFK